MKITKHGQSSFLIRTNERNILIDPGTFVGELENLSAADFPKIDLILITHDHSDHFDHDLVADILDNNNSAILLGTQSVISMIKDKIPNAKAEIVIPGTKKEFADISITPVASEHGPLPNGKPAPEVIGFILDDGKVRFYTPGDSIYLNQSAKNVDVAAVPFCGQVVMNIESAKENIIKLAPKLVIPIHYDSPKYPVKVEDFVDAIKLVGIRISPLKNGESIEL